MRVLEKKKPEALQFVQDRVDLDGNQAERRALEQSWFASAAVYAGTVFVAENGTIRPPRSLSNQRAPYNANLVLPKVLRFVAKMTSVNPVIKVLPNTAAWTDMMAARTAEQAYEHARYVTKFRAKRARAILDSAVYGSGFVKICWNPIAGKGDRIYLDENGRPDVQPLFDDKLRQQKDQAGQYTDVYPGELDCEVVDPFQVWVDPNARAGGFEPARWAAIVGSRHVDEIHDELGVRVEPDSSNLRGAEVYREALAFMASGQTGVSPLAFRARRNDCVREIEMWHIPSRDYPKGRYVRIAGGEVLEDKANPYAASGTAIPLIKYGCFPHPARFWDLSLVEQLRYAQKAYNRSRGHAMAMQESAGHARIFIQKGAGIVPTQIKGWHTTVLEYNAGSTPPIVVPPPQMPQYIAENGAIARGEMNEISAQTDPANSKLPGQLRSGSAIQAVQADSNLILTPSVDKMFEADQRAGVMFLELMSMHYTQKRMLSVLGPTGEIDPKYFTGADLRGNLNLHVVAQPGSLDSAEARTATLMDAAQLQILNPADPEDRMLLLKGLRFHTSDEYVNSVLMQENSEQRQIQRMIEEPDYPGAILPWFDPYIRSKLIERRLNSREFELMPPGLQQRLADRWEEFTKMVAAREAQRLQAIAAAAGAPGEKGTPSQPKR